MSKKIKVDIDSINFSMRDAKKDRGILKITPYLIILSCGLYYAYNYYQNTYVDKIKYDDFKIEQESTILVGNETEDLKEEIVDTSIQEDSEEATYSEIEESETIEESEYTEEPESEEIIEEIPPLPTETYSSDLLDQGYSFNIIDFDKLKEINPDVRGWITIDGTNIDYPVLQYSENNSYYLNHDLYGNESKPGSILQDYRNVSLESPSYELSDLSILYGHYVKNGKKMFAHLHNFKDGDYVNEHPFGIFYTTDGYAYKISFFAGRVVSGKEDTVLYRRRFKDEEAFNEYMNDVYESSLFRTDVEVNYQDKIMALVTCSYEQKNHRFVLYGKLEKQYTNYNQMIMEEENEMERTRK